MKKIFYSMIAVALCSCAQSEVDDNTPTPPQPAKNGLKFEVVNDGFIGEDGTRVSYGNYSEYGNAAAYQATFENGDEIGIFAINTIGDGMMVKDPFADNENAMAPVDGAYIVKNAKLTLNDGNWTLSETDAAGESVDFKNADLLFAYAPYDANKTIPTGESDGRPSFVKISKDDDTTEWAIYTSNSRFFTSGDVTDCGDLEAFKAADMMGAVAKVPTGEDKTVSLKMIHMRGMVEVTVDKDVTLTGLKLITKDNSTFFSPYLFATTSQNVYRILTTKYRDGFTVKAQIKDTEIDENGNEKEITKNYKKEIPASDAGKCSRLNIPYVKLITIGEGGYATLEAALTAKYGDDYATDPTLKSLRLAGTLQGPKNTDVDWATLGKLTTLKKLDMSRLKNTEIPEYWMEKATTLRSTLTSLVLPNGLKKIAHNALQFLKVTSIELPASVTTLGGGAFYGSNDLFVYIPEDSQLQGIYNGAFWGVEAVYTDPKNVNVLKIPASVTSIENNAFGYVPQLKKVIFQDTNTTLTIGNTGAHETFEDYVLIYVPKRDGYEGKFPGNTVIVGPVLTDANYASTPDPLTGGGENGDGLSALCDNNISTFWRTPDSGDAVMGDATYGQYIDISLPEGKTMSSLTVQYVTRQNNNAVPTAVDIYTYNGTDWVKLVALPEEGKTMPTGGNETYTTNKMTPAASFTKIRFAITKSSEGDLTEGASSASTALAELRIGEEIWTEPATPPAQKSES